MDELDAKIIATLRQNGRASNAGIARIAGVSEGTVRRRLKRLIDEEYIFIAAVTNPQKMGASFEALIGIETDLDRTEEIADKLASMEETTWVSITTGPFDIICSLTLPSPEALATFLSNKLGTFDGIHHTESFVHLTVKKRGYGVTEQRAE